MLKYPEAEGFVYAGKGWFSFEPKDLFSPKYKLLLTAADLPAHAKRDCFEPGEKNLLVVRSQVPGLLAGYGGENYEPVFGFLPSHVDGRETTACATGMRMRAGNRVFFRNIRLDSGEMNPEKYRSLLAGDARLYRLMDAAVNSLRDADVLEGGEKLPQMIELVGAIDYALEAGFRPCGNCIGKVLPAVYSGLKR
jgi:hypothetical protein